METPKIVVLPHTQYPVGTLGINEFAIDFFGRMQFPSWERHWRRPNPISKFGPGDIMILSFTSEMDGKRRIVGEGVVMYDGMADKLALCKSEMKNNASNWKACYHLGDVRLYQKMIAYDELKENLTSFNPDGRGKVVLSPDDYTKLLTLTVTTE